MKVTDKDYVYQNLMKYFKRRKPPYTAPVTNIPSNNGLKIL
jgi:hypothetical protein